MTGIIFHFSVVILTVNLFVLTTCLDIHHPEYARAAPTYGYLQTIQPVQQSQYVNPQPNGMYYQGQALDESYHQEADYHRGMAQQNYGHNMRRSSPDATFRQSPCSLARHQNLYRCHRSIPAPTNVPAYSICDGHNYPTANYNQGAESTPIRGRGSRSTMESPKTQSSDDVAARPSIMIPIHSSNTPINFNDTIKKRQAIDPPTIFHDRPNKKKNPAVFKQKPLTDNIDALPQPPSTTLKTTIINPSRYYFNPNANPKSDAPQARETFFDYPSEDYSDCAGGAFGKLKNTKMMVNGRSIESNGGTISYPSDYPEYPKFIGPRNPSENLSTIITAPPVYFQQSSTNVQQPISSYGERMNDSFYKPQEYFKGRSADSFPPASSTLLTNNSRPYPIYTPNIGRNDSMKHHPQIKTSH